MSELSAIIIYEKSSGKSLEGMKSQIADDHENVSDINFLKNRSLYVDIEKNGFVIPTQSISKKMTDEIEQKAKIRYKSEAPIIKPLAEMKKTAQNINKLELNP